MVDQCGSGGSCDEQDDGGIVYGQTQQMTRRAIAEA
jgi:hypothetical protein